MKQVSLRDFSLHPTKWIKELPIVLTRYNLPVAKLISYNEMDRLEEAANYPRPFIGSKKIIGSYEKLVAPPKKQEDYE